MPGREADSHTQYVKEVAATISSRATPTIDDNEGDN
jgi:hypothetical protein